jgi:hypothetical protein
VIRVGVIVILVVATLVIIAIANLKSLAIAAVNFGLGPASHFSAESVEFASSTELWCSDVTLTSRGVKTPILQAEEAFLKFDLRELSAGRLASLHITRPIIRVAAGAPAEVTTTNSPPAAARSPGQKPATDGWPFDIGHLEIEDGRFELRSAGARVPDVKLEFSLNTSEFSFRRLSPKNTATHYLVLKRARIFPPDNERPLIEVPAATIGFVPIELLNDRTIAFVGIATPTIETGAAMERMLAGDDEPGTQPGATPNVAALNHATGGTDERRWTISDLDIRGAKVRMRDLAMGLPEVDFDFSARLQDVPLESGGGWEQVRGATTSRTVVLDNIMIPSPFDALTPVFELGRVTFEFKPIYLLRESLIDSIKIERPKVYIGEDLFWYFDKAAKQDAEAAAVAAGVALPSSTSATGTTATAPAPEKNAWRVRRLDIVDGELYLATGGQVRGRQPFTFSTHQENLRLDNLGALRAELELKIQPSDYDFSNYELRIKGLQGDLKFGYPPEKAENNAVQKLEAAQVKWRQFTGKEFWVSVTYDVNGITAETGGEVCGGYFTGAANFFLRNEWPWVAWVNVNDVDLRQFTDVFTRDIVRVNGRADGSLYLNATNTVFQRILGNLKTRGGGELNIEKLNELLKGIGPDWPKLNASLTTIGVETLRDFSFREASGDFWFAGEEGRLDLNFMGADGSRKFEAIIHAPWDTGERHSPGP